LERLCQDEKMWDPKSTDRGILKLREKNTEAKK